MKEVNTTNIINKNEKASSYEFGPTGNRFKLYFEDADDLNKQIQDLIDLGLYEKKVEIKDGMKIAKL